MRGTRFAHIACMPKLSFRQKESLEKCMTLVFGFGADS